MAFCGKCGSAIPESISFCSKCGAPVSSTSAGATGVATGGSMTSNVAALLTYILGFITGIIFLVLEPYKNDKFVRFHAFQSIFFSVAYMIFWILWNWIFWLGIFSFGFIWTLMSLLSTLIALAVFLFWLFLMYKAYNNERFMIPFIGELAAKQAG